MSQDLVNENRRLREQLSELIANAQKNQEILQRHQTLDLQLISADSFQALADTLFHTFAQSTGLDIVTLTMLDAEYDIRRIVAQLNINLSELPQLLFFEEKSEFGELADKLAKPILGPYTEQLFGPMFPEPILPPASAAVVPLSRHGRVIGSLNLGSKDANRFKPGMATDFIEHLACIVAICLENVINNERLKHIGLTDPLTGVNNRRYVERRLLEELVRSRRQKTALACLFIDIDHFKQINDTIGHQAGDEVLRGVAGRIKAELRMSDALGRFGGEEFLVLLTETELADASNVAERIRQSIAEHPLVLLNGAQLQVTVSIGVAALPPAQSGETLENAAQQFIARADVALYQAKAGGRNRVETAGA